MCVHITIFVPMMFGQVSTWQTVVIGGLIALAPDLDIVSHFFKKSARPNRNHHYSVLHCPLVTVPVGLLAGYLAGGIMWATITTTALVSHYVHDMCSALGGLMILWPFDKRIINIKGQIFPVGKAPLDIWMDRAGPDFHNIWIRDYWLRPSTLSFAELNLSAAISWTAYIFCQNAWPITIVSTGSLIVMGIIWVIWYKG